MKIIPASATILTDIDGEQTLKRIEAAGRTCYKSEDKITAESASAFVAMLIKRGHHSVLEHESVTVRIICDRGVSHEIVRHRLASYSQESTRYCNYTKDTCNGGLTFIEPRPHISLEGFGIWFETMSLAEINYLNLIKQGVKPEIARSVLPNSLKTELVMTCNLREWRHFFKLRTSKAAHPQMREIAVPLRDDFRRLIPVAFDDL
jgi:thymidylate synthase (FAD)